MNLRLPLVHSENEANGELIQGHSVRRKREQKQARAAVLKKKGSSLSCPSFHSSFFPAFLLSMEKLPVRLLCTVIGKTSFCMLPLNSAGEKQASRDAFWQWPLRAWGPSELLL